jgi:hypothetical protein
MGEACAVATALLCDRAFVFDLVRCVCFVAFCVDVVRCERRRCVLVVRFVVRAVDAPAAVAERPAVCACAPVVVVVWWCEAAAVVVVVVCPRPVVVDVVPGGSVVVVVGASVVVVVGASVVVVGASVVVVVAHNGSSGSMHGTSACATPPNTGPNMTNAPAASSAAAPRRTNGLLPPTCLLPLPRAHITRRPARYPATATMYAPGPRRGRDPQGLPGLLGRSDQHR